MKDENESRNIGLIILRRNIFFMAIEVGIKVEGKVTGITHFGAFIELSQGVTGLVHISEIADNYVKDVNLHLKLNDKVLVKVINVDKDGKIGLSIKQTVDRPIETRSISPEQNSQTNRNSYAGKTNSERQERQSYSQNP